MPVCPETGLIARVMSWVGQRTGEGWGVYAPYTRNFGISESDIPRPLKTIIFRIVQDTLKGLAAGTEADQIKVALSLAKNNLQLSITENAYSYRAAGNDARFDGEADAALLPMKERTVFSGGDYETFLNSDGSTLHVARWPV